MAFRVDLRISCKKCKNNSRFFESYAPEDFEDFKPVEFEDAAIDWLKNHNFSRLKNDEWICANCSKTPKPVSQPVAAPVVTFTTPRTQISESFLRRVKAEGCQCERQKLADKPLCGVCFSRLPDELKTLIRTKRGGELEDSYESACEFLRSKKR